MGINESVKLLGHSLESLDQAAGPAELGYTALDEAKILDKKIAACLETLNGLVKELNSKLNAAVEHLSIGTQRYGTAHNHVAFGTLNDPTEDGYRTNDRCLGLRQDTDADYKTIIRAEEVGEGLADDVGAVASRKEELSEILRNFVLDAEERRNAHTAAVTAVTATRDRYKT